MKAMSQIPNELRYTETHEWVRVEGNGNLTIGITDHAQALLGDLVYIELPPINSNVSTGADIGVVESVKAASDVYSPVNGEVVAVNQALIKTPELVNSDPYGAGWLFQIRPESVNEVNALLNAKAYGEKIEGEAH